MGDYGAYVMCLKLQLENLMLRLFTCVYMHGKYADEFYKLVQCHEGDTQ